MKILLSNDDGVSAPGLHAMAAALRGLGEVFVRAERGGDVGPEMECVGMSGPRTT